MMRLFIKPLQTPVEGLYAQYLESYHPIVKRRIFTKNLVKYFLLLYSLFLQDYTE